MEYEKQLESIIGIDKLVALQHLRNKDGLSIQSISEFCHAVRWNTIIAPRKTLENNPNVLHLISYGQVVRANPLGGDDLLIYKRPDNNNGEVKLTGKWSCGIGGHNEIADVAFTNKSVIKLEESLVEAARREASEEIKYSLHGQAVSPETHPELFEITAIGFIVEWDPVGLTHLGVVTRTRLLNPEIQVVSGEDQLEEVQFRSLITAEEVAKFEGWSQILLKSL